MSEDYPQPGHAAGPHFRRKLLHAALLACAIGALSLAVLFGKRAYQAYELKDIYARYYLHMPRLLTDADWGVFNDTAKAARVPCAEVLGDRTMVALALGQSNAANSVNVRYTPRHDVYVYYDNACYKADDPLLGSSGVGGSVWTRLGDKLIEGGLYAKVLFVPIARGGSSILNWGKYGDLRVLLRKTAQQLTKDGIRLTHVLFHQGEADCCGNLGRDNYRAILASVIEQVRSEYGATAPFFISQASLCYRPDCPDVHDPGCYTRCPDILRAQADLVSPRQRIYAGPDTDRIVPIDQRPDGSHFSAQGANAFANAWLEILANQPRHQN